MLTSLYVHASLRMCMCVLHMCTMPRSVTFDWLMWRGLTVTMNSPPLLCLRHVSHAMLWIFIWDTGRTLLPSRPISSPVPLHLTSLSLSAPAADPRLYTQLHSNRWGCISAQLWVKSNLMPRNVTVSHHWGERHPVRNMTVTCKDSSTAHRCCIFLPTDVCDAS